MAIDYDKLLALKIPDAEHSYGDKDTMLYALGGGIGLLRAHPSRNRHRLEAGGSWDGLTQDRAAIPQ